MNLEKARESLKSAEVGGEGWFHYENIPGYVLVPGDPDRISMMAEQWDPGANVYSMKRGYAAAIGSYQGAPIGAASTGIGGPSSEQVFTRLAENGAHTLIRVGTTGAIQPEIQIGDIIINDSNVRLDGCSNLYVRPEYPAAASFEVTMALVQACENLGFRYHVGTGCTCGSFYVGQCRTGYGGYRPGWLDDEFSNMQQAHVLNFEMEGAALTTLARIFGLRAGMCATVVAHRLTGEWDENIVGESNSCLVGAEAIRILTEWDRRKKEAGKDFFFPGLLTI